MFHLSSNVLTQLDINCAEFSARYRDRTGGGMLLRLALEAAGCRRAPISSAGNAEFMQLLGGIGMKLVVAFSIAAAAGSTFAQKAPTGILAICGSSQVADLVKQTVHEKMLPAWLGRIEPKTFSDATRVDAVSTTRTDAPLNLVECRGTLSVEAWHGLDTTVDQAIQMTLANDPDVLAALPQSFSGPADRRRYNVPIVFSAQKQSAQLVVHVGRISSLQGLLTTGFLKKKQEQGG
ncbi:hypothetical protein [Roseateles sp.]|uniref:hypothetical protein n=1 Tax=Roseateles sp. TaxID=1971397 RepID=UPI003265DE4A